MCITIYVSEEKYEYFQHFSGNAKNSSTFPIYLDQFPLVSFLFFSFQVC